MLKYITLLAIIYFFYWLIKHKIRQRKLESQGYQIEQQGMRPVTILSIVLVVIYGGYLLYYLATGGENS
ncbi:hypothetical protein [Thiomicrorhabdus xiamenensis]|uniref:Uncharacterized protein n=1 Tax=Thiomicrorhabdus xiamenensis TaxID=2739063 RepID=A0A7D4TE05_9GAMM|nr:hypothetical protein [Thiomicrorhabdus xiamenensis]QKI89027.1 hypothetical protein HQN79_05285 [Thiomicrorhabdus xiamenensis]